MDQRQREHPFERSAWPRVEHLAGDASERRYSRLGSADGRTVILVEYPASIRRQLVRDLEVLDWCRRRGLAVPHVVAADPAAGRALLEDLGPEDAETRLAAAAPERRPALLTTLLAPLATLARCDPSELPPWNPPLDRDRLRWELTGFELWFVGHHRSSRPTPTMGRWLDELAGAVAGHPTRVCHRDYHLNNLLIRPDGSVGVIDVQDILVGPDTYDAVSLVAERAAARLIGPDDRRSVLAEWARRTGAARGWRERARLVRIQRGLKVLGTFARFDAAGRSGYRGWMVELARDLAEPLAAAGAPPEIAGVLLD